MTSGLPAGLGTVEPDAGRDGGLGAAWTAFFSGEFSAALRRLRACVAQAPGSVDLEAIKLFRRLGRPGEAAECLKGALRLQDSLEQAHELGILAIELGRFDEALGIFRRLVERDHGPALARAAELSLWARDLDLAQVVLAAAQGRAAPAVLRLREAVAEALAGRWVEASALFDFCAASRPSHAETLLWRAEARRRTGRAAEALADVKNAIAAGGSSLSSLVGSSLVELQLGKPLSKSACMELQALIPEDWPVEEPPLGAQSSSGQRSRLERLVEGLAGNRTARVTFVHPRTGRLCDGSPAHPRRPMRELQARLGWRPLATVLRRFAEEIDSRRGSPEALHWGTHRGEVLLWAGRYEESLPDFERALGSHGTRWSPVGLAAGRLMIGDLPGARRALEQARSLGTPANAIERWEGEWLRRSGRHQEAAALLERVLKRPPLNPAVAINLALSSLTLGRAKEAAGLFQELALHFPVLIGEAAASSGAAGPSLDRLPVGAMESCLEAALASMRGNRSSWFPTFMRRGRLRPLVDTCLPSRPRLRLRDENSIVLPKGTPSRVGRRPVMSKTEKPAEKPAEKPVGKPAQNAAGGPPEGDKPPPSDFIIQKGLVIEATAEEIWSAWTTAEGLASFFSPKAAVRLEKSGAYEVLTAGEEKMTSRGRILDVSTGELLAFEWIVPQVFSGVGGQGTRVEVRMKECAEDSVHVALDHTGWGKGLEWYEAYHYCQEMWDIVLGRLKHRFEQGPIDWKKPYTPKPVTKPEK